MNQLNPDSRAFQVISSLDMILQKGSLLPFSLNSLKGHRGVIFLNFLIYKAFYPNDF